MPHDFRRQEISQILYPMPNPIPLHFITSWICSSVNPNLNTLLKHDISAAGSTSCFASSLNSSNLFLVHTVILFESFLPRSLVLSSGGYVSIPERLVIRIIKLDFFKLRICCVILRIFQIFKPQTIEKKTILVIPV